MDHYQFSTFKIFNSKELAEDFAEVLKEQEIPYFIENDALSFDASFANSPLSQEYTIKIAQTDFERAGKAYENYFSAKLNDVDPDYYLFTFTDGELKDILAKPDEWGTFDYELSQKILKERGVEVSEDDLRELKERRYKQLQRPEKEEGLNILLYYLLSFFIFPLGFVIGWIWAYSKKQLPDGKRVYAYDANTRRHGRIIFVGASALLCITCILRIFGSDLGLGRSWFW